jgi:hypothetical protein
MAAGHLSAGALCQDLYGSDTKSCMAQQTQMIRNGPIDECDQQELQQMSGNPLYQAIGVGVFAAPLIPAEAWAWAAS